MLLNRLLSNALVKSHIDIMPLWLDFMLIAQIAGDFLSIRPGHSLWDGSVIETFLHHSPPTVETPYPI